jgi:hypothetical protein
VRLAAEVRVILLPAAALAIALTAGSASGQSTNSRNDVVWHWFGDCASGDSLVVDVRFDGKDIYSSTLPVCKMRRSQIKPEPQQRFLSFEFVALPRRFRAGNKEPEPVPIRGAIWETDGDATSIRLGVQFAMEGLSLLNAHHPARIASETRTEPVRGLLITTRPVKKTAPKPAAAK